MGPGGFEASRMLETPHTTQWELALDIFGYTFRPCRGPQETIYEYHMDGRPRFEWEYFRQRYILESHPRIVEYCAECPVNIMGEVEGCKCQVENLDIFFRALNELTPDSLWAKFPRDGSPVASHQTAALLADLLGLKQKLKELTWPVAIPRHDGQPFFEEIESLDSYGEVEIQLGPMQFYAWNGEGPPGLMYLNEGYTIYLSRHGLMVKPTGQDPIPYVFKRLWREDMGVFGEDTKGEQIGFDVLVGRYPTWAANNDTGSELGFEALPASQVFAEILDLLEVYCSVAEEFEVGFLIKAPQH